jgi:hypothetical protein
MEEQFIHFPVRADGIDQALAIAATLPADVARLLRQSVHQAFDSAYLVALAVNAALLTAVAVMAWRARAVPQAVG